MSVGVVELLVSLTVTSASVPLVRVLLVRRGLVDLPNPRSSHRSPTPRGAGLACLLGVLTALAVTQAAGRNVPLSAVAAAVVLALLGFADDRSSLPAVRRLVAQVLVGCLLGLALGGGWLLVVGGLLTPLVVNIVNFMDGINGITSLSAAGWGLTAWVVAAAQGIPQLGLIGAVTAGSALGFLPWNAPTAKVFLGDAGSYLFGGLVTAGLMVGWSAGASPLLLAAPLALYLADTGTVLLRRLVRGDPVMQAHREHVYQRMVSSVGLPHLAVAGLVVVLALLVTLAWARTPWYAASAVTLLVCGLYLAAPTTWSNVTRRSLSDARRAL